MSDPTDNRTLEDLISGRPTSHGQRRFIWLAVVAALAALTVLTVRFLTGHDTSYLAEPVTRGTIEPRLILGGMLGPTQETDIGVPIAGTVTEVAVTENQRVTEGQVLARIDPVDAGTQIAGIEAGMTTARAEIASAQTARNQAASSLARIEEVYRKSGGRVPSRREVEDARAAVRTRTGDLQAAQARLREGQARLSDGKQQAERSVIRSPIDGYVLVNNARVGALESDTGQTLFTLTPDVGRMRVDVMVPQAQIGDVRRGQRVALTVSSVPDRRFQGWVHEVTTTAVGSPAAFRVTVFVVNSDKLLRRGMRATVDIRLPQRKNALLIPNSAFHFEPTTSRAPSERNDGRETLYRLNQGGGIDPVAVSAGSTDGTWTEIHSDALREGDLVAVGWRGAAATGQPAPK